MQRARGLTQKHNFVSKRLHNLPAIAPRFWIVVALFSVIYIRFGNTDADLWRNYSGVLLPVKALSKIFREKFSDQLRELFPTRQAAVSWIASATRLA
jgi:hypothetical protein